MMRTLRDLFDAEQLEQIENAPLTMGARNSTWFPLFYDKPRTIDYLVNNSVGYISQRTGGDEWLRDLAPRLLDLESVDSAASALAEIRAYGGLLHAGFNVNAIKRKGDATPDFSVNAGDGEVIVEVFAKHQDKKEDQIQRAVHDLSATLPLDVTRRTFDVTGGTITTTTCILNPAGRPDPSKPNDSVQANVISRICGIKADEKQLPEDKPSILLMDFANFGGPLTAGFMRPSQAAPIETGHQGICCGPFWYALYGWIQAPIFDEVSRAIVRMGHDGRFRNRTKLSAVLVVLMDSVVLLENPWANHRLPDLARLTLCRYPWFKLPHSMADWKPGDLKDQISIHRRMIDFMENHFLSFWCDR